MRCSKCMSKVYWTRKIEVDNLSVVLFRCDECEHETDSPTIKQVRTCRNRGQAWCGFRNNDGQLEF